MKLSPKDAKRILLGLTPGQRIDKAIRRLEVQTVVDAVPVVHAHWIEVDGVIETYSECSACGYHTQDDKYFCPWCGARMDEEA